MMTDMETTATIMEDMADMIIATADTVIINSPKNADFSKKYSTSKKNVQTTVMLVTGAATAFHLMATAVDTAADTVIMDDTTIL